MFITKNYKKFKLIDLTLLITLIVFTTSTVKAHEMWIQPLNYSIQMGNKIFANEIVGQNFKGNKYAYLDSSYKSLNITVGEKTKAIKSRLGDLPTIQEQSAEEGLHIITAETTPAALVYVTPEKFAKFLNLNKGYQAIIYGHTDSKNKSGKNKEISQNRANSVKDALVKAGVSESRLTAIGMGCKNPIADNATPEGRAKNRRIEVELLQ